MADQVTFGDATTVVLAVLRTALPDVPAGARVPNPRPARFLRAFRTGGPRANLVADRPTMVVESWAGSDEAAHDLAQAARAALAAAAGSVVAGTTIYQVKEVSGPGALPDTSGQPRWTQTFALTVRGTPR